MDSKRPTRKWKRYQTCLASENTIRKWFCEHSNWGIAVIFGKPSRNLISRDFDCVNSYKCWANLHPKLAETLPTVETNRGCHVYAMAALESVTNARRFLSKEPNGIGAIDMGDGELRAGAGCYSLLPPSIHPTGKLYKWLIPLPDGPLTEIDPINAGFTSCYRERRECYRENGVHRENTDNGRTQRKTEAMESIGDLSSEVLQFSNEISAMIDIAIKESLPNGSGQRHRLVFEFARKVKAIPELSDAKAVDLEGVVRAWHKVAIPNISTKPFEETWIDFLKAFPRVRFPAGEEPMQKILEAAKRRSPPSAAAKYEQPRLKLLVSICAELQRAAGDGEFFLACRTAAKLIGVDHMTANRWLFLMTSEKVLTETQKGTLRPQRASRYRFNGNAH